MLLIDGVRHSVAFNTLKSRQNRRYFANDIFKRISLHERLYIVIFISMKSVSNGSIDNKLPFFWVMVWPNMQQAMTW